MKIAISGPGAARDAVAKPDVQKALATARDRRWSNEHERSRKKKNRYCYPRLKEELICLTKTGQGHEARAAKTAAGAGAGAVNALAVRVRVEVRDRAAAVAERGKAGARVQGARRPRNQPKALDRGPPCRTVRSAAVVAIAIVMPGTSGDAGRPFVRAHTHTAMTQAFARIVRPLLELD